MTEGGGIKSATVEELAKKATSGTPIESSVVLLGCPFCGSAAVLWQWIHPVTPGYSETVTHSIECSKACASTSDEVKPEWVIEIWNRRVPPVDAQTGSDAKSSSHKMACRTSALSSRICEQNTKGCTVYH